MSTVSVSNIKNASSSVNSAVTTSGGDLTNAAGVSFMGGSKNLLYNGSMQVAQRGTSTASITTTGYYTADRYQVVNLTQGTWTNDIQNDAPTGSGLRKSLRMLCTTADASPAAADMIGIDQVLEGQDLQRLAKGTASAQQMTISFWVKSNVTGTYIVSMYDNDSSPARSVCGSYTISASATWEKKSITFPADLTGPFDNDNAASLYVRWYLGAGSNRTSGTLATAWATFAQANDAVGQVNVAAAINNYWQVTGVQLEVGPVATSFEFKSYGQELRECQRYYQRITPAVGYGSYGIGQAYGTTAAEVPVRMGQEMRAAVSAIDTSGTASHYGVSNSTMGAVSLSVVPTLLRATSVSAVLTCTVASGLTAGNATHMIANASGNGYIGFSAEL